MESFDYLIVGAGAAGCVLAYRLSENPHIKVCLIEAGPRDTHPFISMPKGLAKVMSDLSTFGHTPASPMTALPGNRRSGSAAAFLGARVRSTG